MRESSRSATVLDMEKFAGGRFIHAKVIIAQTDDEDNVLYGSANCTAAALGRPGFSGINEESCFYRRLPRSKILSSLGLLEIIEREEDIASSNLPEMTAIVQGTLVHQLL